MKNPRKNILKIAIDSPAAAGAGTQAKLISKHYNLMHLDTGRCYRYIANIKITEPSKYNYKFIKKKMDKLKIKNLHKKIRMLVHSFQLKCAYNPPKRFKGSCLDGRDICSVIIPDADIKLFITANLKTRAMRRYKELKGLNKKITYEEVLKSIKNRDKSDFNRKISPLKKTKDSVLINTTNLTKRACFLKIKKIIDRKINI
jgi:cytidylate kinase